MTKVKCLTLSSNAGNRVGLFVEFKDLAVFDSSTFNRSAFSNESSSSLGPVKLSNPLQLPVEALNEFSPSYSTSLYS